MRISTLARHYLFDSLIIVVIILTAFGFFWFRQSKKDEWINVTVRVTNDEWWYPGATPEQWYSDGLKVDDTAFDSFGKPVAKIVQLDLADVGSGMVKTTVRMQLLVRHDVVKQMYLFNFQPLQIGKSVDLSFGDHNIKGLVTSVNQPNEKQSIKKIDVKLTYIDPWVAESFKQNLKSTNPQGKIDAEILKIQVLPNSSRVFSDKRGEMILVTNNDFRDVYATLAIAAYQVDKVWYFQDGAQLKIGDEVWIHFPTTTMKNAQIIKVYLDE